MKQNQLEQRILKVIPEAQFEFDCGDQLIIYTNLSTDDKDNLIEVVDGVKYGLWEEHKRKRSIAGSKTE